MHLTKQTQNDVSRSVGGVWRCSWALGVSTHDVRHAGTFIVTSGANRHRETYRLVRDLSARGGCIYEELPGNKVQKCTLKESRYKVNVKKKLYPIIMI